MIRQIREDCCNAIVVILNLQGFQNLQGCSNILNKGSFSSSKHVCVRQRNLRESLSQGARPEISCTSKK
ncbi:MAG: hypothetical protein GDA51_06920 [Ekhidna sp.]|nr:hypothetical protein [Ekhidna sp.]